jgi:hypothetical protein
MVGWLAFQQFIGLQLWGAGFDPDWVVVMDGFNDAAMGCGLSQGTGNPEFTATMRSYIDGYLLSQENPPFYRGWLENEMLAHSAAYRFLTGQQPVRDDRTFDFTRRGGEEVLSQIVPTRVGDSRAMLGFYLNGERATLKLFPRARYILSTQPSVNQFSGDFPDIYTYPAGSDERRTAIAKRTAALERYLNQYGEAFCGERTAQPSFTYIFGNGAVQLEAIVADAKAQGRDARYFNIGRLFPDARRERIPYFIDSVHLSDRGADAIGRFYAEQIVRADATTDADQARPPSPN